MIRRRGRARAVGPQTRAARRRRRAATRETTSPQAKYARPPGAAPPRHPPARIADYRPRQCGIATFTFDLRGALARQSPASELFVVAMNDAAVYDYPTDVSLVVPEGDPDAYVAAAEYLNFCDVEVAIVEHEFGIFGGEAGDFLLPLLDALTMPVVVTLHTVLEDPNPAQARVMAALIARSSRLLVMAEKGRAILRARYGVPDAQIEVIPHGVPDCAFLDSALPKDMLGFGDRPVLLTFGLLGPGKGIETMIEAMPAIVAAHPDALYVVLGATHPNLKRHEGERYRLSLTERAAELGVGGNVLFIDDFVDEPRLLEYVSAADVYVTPYLNEAQITSGTLAVSFGMGKPIVSTPYWHAKELLANDHGVLVPFRDTSALAGAVVGLLGDDRRRNALRKRAYLAARSTIWPVVAQRHLDVFAEVVAERQRGTGMAAGPNAPLPPLTLAHLASMTDGTGLLQHALWSVADRAHGYCLDDNARALLLMADVARHGAWTEAETRMALVYAAFVQHAWNAERRHFRNFMSYDRRWIEEVGADDAHGRAVWCLGVLAEREAPRQLGDWSARLLLAGAGPLGAMASPHAWAYGALGVCAFLRRFPGHREMGAVRDRLAGLLRQRLLDCATDDWFWFEDRLGYDNARLPEALVALGVGSGRDELTVAGLRALEWLMALQTAPEGHFRPVGTASFGRDRLPPLPFDQQAIEAQAAVGACLRAREVTGDARWSREAARAFAWFTGANDLRVAMADLQAGAGFDGLHPDRRNANQGAESTLAYLGALSDMHAATAGDLFEGSRGL